MARLVVTAFAGLWLVASLTCQVPTLDERPRQAGEWGIRPALGATLQVTPPVFVCRPQTGASSYEWQAGLSASFTIGVRYAKTRLPVHCPDGTFGAGKWFWRFRCLTEAGASAWSKTRTFTIPEGLTTFAMPDRSTLLGRLPKTHPRLFVRPEELPALRKRAADKGPGEKAFSALLARCASFHQKRPVTEEPSKYPKGIVRGSEAWRKIWWGNRRATIAALAPAADLAFAGVVGGESCARHTELAKELLLAVAKWRPRGATGFAYNDEAAMPYAYLFSRAYTFLHASLSENERVLCRQVMKERGTDIQRDLVKRQHLFRPFGSHANRAWHFLGEVGIAFAGEIDAAEDWVWYASRVFGAVYPAWGDADGGWHEGLAYWRSYLSRFSWWADVQKSAYGVDAYAAPFFAKVGDFPLYLLPPGTPGGGFGDLSTRRDERPMAIEGLLGQFATAAKNPYWQWRAAQADAAVADSGFVAFLRSQAESVPLKSPVDLPTSKCFRGTGVAVLNHTLLSAKDNVQVLFKSSPYGTQSHGYDAQNSFLLYAFGERLLIRSGRRDQYGSAHHQKWMWSTRSGNSITVDGDVGQWPHSARSIGRIDEFRTSRVFDYVVGEAGAAYAGLSRFTRRILFVKPDYIVIHDTLEGDKPRTFDYWLHALRPFTADAKIPNRVTIRGAKASCHVQWLTPVEFAFERTAKCDPPPRPRIQLQQHHLTASTKKPQKSMTFVTVLRPFRTGADVEFAAKLESVKGGYRVRLDEDVVVELQDRRTQATRGTAKFDSSKPVPTGAEAAGKKR